MGEAASILLVTCHLLAADVAAAGPLAALGLKYLARRHGDAALDRLGRAVAFTSLAAIGVAIVLGLVQLGLLWRGNVTAYFDALRVVPTSRLWFGAVELAFSAALVTAFVVTWRFPQRRPWWHAALAIVSATNLLYHFPTLFSVVSVVSTRPDLRETAVDFRELLFSGETLARALHHLLAAFAAAGAAAMTVALARWPAETAQRATTFGARLALSAVSLQFLVGPLVLVTLPAALQNRVLGGDAWATGFLSASVIVTFVMTQSLAQASMGAVTRPTAIRLIVLIVLVIGLMVATRHQSRLPLYQPPPLPAAQPQP